MGRANKDVGGYRGRRTITDIVRFIAIALAVAVVLVVLKMLQKVKINKLHLYKLCMVRITSPLQKQMMN